MSKRPKAIAGVTENGDEADEFTALLPSKPEAANGDRPHSSQEARTQPKRARGLIGLMGRTLRQFLPSDELNIYGVPSMAILMSYFSVGVALELLATPVAYYLIYDLGEDSSVYTVWYILVYLPWSFKVCLEVRFLGVRLVHPQHSC